MIYPNITTFFLIFALLPSWPMMGQPVAPWAQHGELQISANGHYLQHADGTPFLWIADTGWGLLSQLDQSEVATYLDNRQRAGFNIIQTVAFWYPHGGNLPDGPHNPPNAYGRRPFEGEDDAPNTAHPLLVGNADPDNPDDYWDHADFVVREAKRRGLYLALLPCWGSAYIQARRKGSHVEFTEEEARTFGAFLGERYGKEPHIIWVLGGDIDPENHGVGDQKAVYRAMAEGIGRGVTGNPDLRWDGPDPNWDQLLMTFHAVRTPPQALGGSSSTWFHQDPWLDINMMETWAWAEHVYPLVLQDYRLTDPVKPTIMGEGAYEYGRYLDECGWVSPRRARQQAYHTFFGGATGHTYGAYAIWPMRGHECGISWQTALQLPGARQVGSILRQFLEKHQWWQWKPAPEVLLGGAKSGEEQVVAATRPDGALLCYFPHPDSVQLSLEQFGAPATLSPQWFNPETGAYVPVENWQPSGSAAWCHPPKDWEDAVLVVEE